MIDSDTIDTDTGDVPGGVAATRPGVSLRASIGGEPTLDGDELNVGNVADYLRAQHVVPATVPVQAVELGWGISNVVLKASWPEGCVVVKQSLPALRVAADWPFDRARTLVERDCLSLLGEIVPGAVPELLLCDERRYVLAISCVPPDGVLWKQALLAGEVEQLAAARAGELLGRIHRLAADDGAARERFADQTVLLQGRIDPFHMTAAAAHPELAPAIEREVKRMLATQLTLTLGDYSPKNLFIYPDRVMAIDFEVAHWGDPAFDVAFCLTHLALKAFHLPDHAEDLLAAAGRLWREYRIAEDGLCEERAVVSELGCLLLARIDGKSPAEYIRDESVRQRVRALAALLISAPEDSVTAALAEVHRHVVDLAGEDAL